ncbi:MAG: hypothetical protein ACPGRC_06020 [Salibacteraceae bacterium]
MKALLFLLFASLLLTFSPLSTISQTTTTLLNENFSSNSTPSGWSNSEPSGFTGKWEFNDPYNRNISGGNFSGNYALVDSDGIGNGNSQKTKLTSPAFDASGYTTVTLEYDYQYRDYNGPESCKVQVYNGSSWVTVTTYTLGDENYSDVDHVTVDITSDIANATNAKVRFFYRGEYDWWFALDNVKITGEIPAITSLGEEEQGQAALIILIMNYGLLRKETRLPIMEQPQPAIIHLLNNGMIFQETITMLFKTLTVTAQNF